MNVTEGGMVSWSKGHDETEANKGANAETDVLKTIKLADLGKLLMKNH